MMKTSLCLAMLVAAPAAARTAPPPAPVPAVSDGGADAKRYCISRDPATGDKMMRPRCRTLAEWQRQGVELPVRR